MKINIALTRILATAVMLSATFLQNITAADYRPEKYKVDVESAGVGANDTFLYRVICNADTPQAAEGAAAECAIYGIIFQGSKAAGNNPAQTPLLKSETLIESQTVYFDNFFANKRFKQYVANIAKSSIKIIKVKKGYRVDVIVSVDKRKLRLDLESAGIIEKLGQVFEN